MNVKILKKIRSCVNKIYQDIPQITNKSGMVINHPNSRRGVLRNLKKQIKRGQSTRDILFEFELMLFKRFLEKYAKREQLKTQ